MIRSLILIETFSQCFRTNWKIFYLISLYLVWSSVFNGGTYALLQRPCRLCTLRYFNFVVATIAITIPGLFRKGIARIVGRGHIYGPVFVNPQTIAQTHRDVWFRRQRVQSPHNTIYAIYLVGVGLLIIQAYLYAIWRLLFALIMLCFALHCGASQEMQGVRLY